MSRTKKADAYFDSGYSCAQAVLATFGESFGLEADMAIKVAGAFGGGMSNLGQVCGAVTGALMVIGLKHGVTGEAKQHTYEISQDFVKHFIGRHGTMLCPELIGHNLGVPEERVAAKEKGLFSTRCSRYVRDAVEILEEML